MKKFLVEDTNKGEPVTTCMDVYKAKIQAIGILDKIKLRIVVRGDLYNKELVGDTWSPTAYMRTLKYFLGDATKHKARVHQVYFIGAFLQANLNRKVYLKLDSKKTRLASKIFRVLWKSLEIIEVPIRHE